MGGSIRQMITSAGTVAFLAGAALLATGALGWATDATAATLATPTVEAFFHPETGQILEVKDLAGGRSAVERVTDRYEIEDEERVLRADETTDRITDRFVSADGQRLRFSCANPDLPGLVIEKVYFFEEDERTLAKRVTFHNAAVSGFFIKYFTDAQAGAPLLQNGWFHRSAKHGDYLRRPGDLAEPFQLGHDQTEIHRVMLVAPQQQLGAVHYRYLVDNRVSLYQTSNNFAQYAAWKPDGWRFSICAFRLDPGDARTAQVNLEINDGDVMAFYVRYRQRPQIDREIYHAQIPAWVPAADMMGHGNHLEIEDGERTFQPWWDCYEENGIQLINLGLRGLSYRVHWGGTLSAGKTMVWPHGFRSGKEPYELNLDEVWKTTRDKHRQVDRMTTGFYTLMWWSCSRSHTFKEHPEFMIWGKDGEPDFEPSGGKPRPCDSCGSPSYSNDLGAPGAIEHFAKMYGDMARNFEFDHVYIDGGPTGVSRLNWKRKAVPQSYLWIDAQRAIRDAVREANPQGAFFLNADRWHVADINFWEYGTWHRPGKDDWRIIPVGLALAKINSQPDTAVVPMRWASWIGPRGAGRRIDLHEPLYPNYLLGFGLTPHGDNITLGIFKKRLPIIRAAKELRGSVMVDAGLDPAWWKSYEPTAVEGYTLRRGNVGLVPFMSRQKDDASVEVSFDTAPLGLSGEFPVYTWVNAFIPPAIEQLNSVQSGRHTEPEGPYPRAFAVRSLARTDGFVDRVSGAITLPGAGDRIGLNEPGPLQLVVAASVPAWIYEAEGYRYHSALPEQDGIKVSPASGRDNEFRFRVWTEKEGTKLFFPQALLPFPVRRQADMEGDALELTETHWDEEEGWLITVPTGLHVVTFVRAM